MAPVLLLLSLFASASAICENSPITPVQLQGILSTALKSLSDIKNGANTYIPNLVVGQQPWWSTTKPCNKSIGQVQNCGYPVVFTTGTTPGQGSDANSWTFLPNPSVVYSGALINQTKILHPTDPLGLSDVAFQIDFSEAIIWLGCTPDVTYFAHSKLLWSVAPPVTDPTTQVLGGLGDTLNNYNLKSARVNTAKPGGGATLIIYTSSQSTYNYIAKAFTSAGFPASAINVDPFPTNLVTLGSKGAFFGVGSRSSNLTLAETAYLFTPQTGYLAQTQAGFPYVHLKPLIEHCEDAWHPSLASLSTWKPKVDQSKTAPPQSAFSQSETVYERNLQAAVAAIVPRITQALTQASGGALTWRVYTQSATYAEETGEQHLFQHSFVSHGAAGTRDNNYYFYNPGVVPKYGSTNFSIFVGLRHDSLAWTAPPFSKPTPHALFWNLVFSDNSFLGVRGHFNNKDASVLSYTTLPGLGGSAGLTGPDPLNAIWVRVTGVTGTSVAPIKNALAGLGVSWTDDASLANIYPLVGLHRTYVNPDTGVAPWLGSILPPIQIHAVGVPPV